MKSRNNFYIALGIIIVTFILALLYNFLTQEKFATSPAATPTPTIMKKQLQDINGGMATVAADLQKNLRGL